MNESLWAAFTHLHVHSHYTLLGAVAAIPDLVSRAVKDGLSSLALTDTAVLIGAVQFNQACQEAGIKPIIGLVVPLRLPASEVRVTYPAPGQLLLLATGADGYRSLCRIASAIQTDKNRLQKLRQGIGWQVLRENQAGLICLDGGRMGWTERFLRAGNMAAAVRFASQLGGIFAENGGLSLEVHTPADTAVCRELSHIAGRFGLMTTAVQPVYHLQPEEQSKLRLLAAIDQNCLLSEVAEAALPGFGEAAVSYHWRSPDQLAETFAEFPEAVKQTGAIAARCRPPLPDGRPLWPKLNLPAEQTPAQALAAMAEDGLQQHYGPQPAALVRARLQKELKAINEHGFAPLFLVVADITHQARETAVPVNTRGSVANSLVAYCVGITQVDPIEHDLLFERFLNPARANLPDIDLDFCSRRRDEILNYVRDTYGEDRVALVATISTLQPKSAVRETAKAYGLTGAEIKRLSGLVPGHWHPDPRRRQGTELDAVLSQPEDERERAILQTAFALVGLPHHLSIHPGGLVITPTALTEVVPVQLAPKGFLTTQFDFRDVEIIGLPKIDLLGIRALTVLADTAELVQANREAAFTLNDIPLDDEATAVTLTQAETIGVFQCESTGAQRTLRQLQAKNIRDLAVANAFFKPGPALGGMAQAFVRRYRGQEEVTYLHPLLLPILESTQGVLLFQEQILRIATEIAGLSWAEADHLRKGMSKFQAREMAAIRLRFVRGCQENAGFSREQAETLWQQVEPFAGYGFNQGHATAYADISYRSAFLKTHYPAEFLCARLADHGGFHHPVIYIAEAQRLGIMVRPPHVNFSGRKMTLTTAGSVAAAFKSEDEAPAATAEAILWLGLGQVRDLRQASIRAIIKQRPYRSLRDLLARVSLQAKEITHLIQAGACIGLGDSRSALLQAAAEIGRAGSARQMAFAFSEPTAVSPETSEERIAWETKLLGWPVSTHPLTLFKSETEDDVPLRFVPRLRNQKTSIAGVRLPGWTGGKGYYFGDGDSFIVCRAGGKRSKKPSLWQPVRLTGYWREDEWGNGWFEVTRQASI